MSLQWTRVQMKALLTGLKAADATLDGAKVRLFMNDVTPDMDTVLGDLTTATYTGYADSADLVWGVPYVNSLGAVEMAAGSVEFSPSDDAAPCTIYGYAILDEAAGLFAAERIEPPFPMVAADDNLIIVPRVSIKNPAV